MENMNWNYPTPIWFGLDRVKEIQNGIICLKKFKAYKMGKCRK